MGDQMAGMGMTTLVDGKIICKPRTFMQPCNWMEEPSLLGKKLYVLPSGLGVDDTFPYKCAAGLLGSNDTNDQISAKCAGLCPAGFTCPKEATSEPIVCPRGSYCPEGSTTALPCPG